MEQPNFKKICMMHIQQLTNFPFIEDDIDALTDYGFLCRVVAHLNSVIENQNTTNQAVINLYNAFNTLKEYIDNYFDNLDVQDEINNKLDEMAQSGELNEYIKKLDYFIVDNTFIQEDIQKLMNIENAKIIEFKNGTYNFNDTFILNNDTTLLLNNADLIFTNVHAFFNFNSTDEFLEYNGNGNIKIIGGKLNAGISLLHGKNIDIENTYFYHNINDHMIELCSCKNINIKNCIFEGVVTQENDRKYVENIQIDDCTYINFPWLDENNPTYDGTPNYNINIEKCKFINPDIITYSFYTAIGNHTNIDGTYHKFINIKDNEFTNSENDCIRLNNTVNVNINNNIFYTENEDIINAINLQYYQKDIKIENNNSNYKSFVYDNTRGINISIIGNYIHDIPYAADTASVTNTVIFTQPATNFIVKDNLFENVYIRLLDNRSRSNITENEIIIFENNILRCSNNTTFSQYLVALYGINCAYISNNITDINPSNTITFLRLSNTLSNIYYKNNLTHKKNNIDLNGYTNTLGNVYGNAFIVATLNVDALDDYTIQNYSIFDFNRVAVTCGAGNNTQNYVFGPFFYQNKLDERTYKINCVDNSFANRIMSFTINEDGTLDYSVATGTLNIRQIVLYNE